MAAGNGQQDEGGTNIFMDMRKLLEPVWTKQWVLI